MYDDNLTRIPTNDVELWQLLSDNLDMIEMALFDAGVETRENAIAKRDNGFLTIRYRGVSEGEDNRDHFLIMGRELFPQVRSAVDARLMSPSLVQMWGILQFCHGFVAAHILDDTDPMALHRAGHKRGKQVSRDPQRKWLSHVIVRLRKAGLTRVQAEQRTVEIIRGIRTESSFPTGFDDNWYAKMITHGELAATYDEKHLSVKRMNELVRDPTDDIPPIPEIP